MAPDGAKPGWSTAVLTIAAIWLGVLIGVSFLATPVKFMAPSLSLPVALDVGRHTFAVFNKAEWFLSAVFVVAVWAGDRTRLEMSAAALMAVLVFVETVWLLPVLDQRVGVIIAGGQPEPSSLHNLYIAFEAAKLLVLIFVVVRVGRWQGVPVCDRERAV